MRKLLVCTILMTSVVACGVSSPIKKASESESEFSDDPYKKVKPIKGNPDIYRIYGRAATGFVPMSAEREGEEERARKFCNDKGKDLELLASEQSNPPYIVGNFPRIEFIFMCIDKKVPSSTAASRLNHLSDLKKMLDNGTLTQQEFDSEKKKIIESP